MRTRDRVERGIVAASIAAFLACFAATSLVSPMNGEDFGLSLPITDDGSTPSSAELWARSMHQIESWNARLGEQLAILWLGVGETAFVVANTLAFAVFVAIVTVYATRRVRPDVTSAWVACVCAASTWLAWPSLEIFFWTTTAGNYFHPMVLLLAAGLPFLLHDELASLGRTRAPLLIVFGAIAVLVGVSSENGPPALVGTMVVFAAVRWWRSRTRPSAYEILTVVSLVAGWIVLMTQPSTRFRVEYYRQLFGTPPYSTEYFVTRLEQSWPIFAQSGRPIAIATGLALVAVGVLRRRDTVLAIGPAYFLPLTAALLCANAVVLGPYTEPRAFLYVWITAFVLAMRCVAVVIDSAPEASRVVALVLVVGGLFSASSTYAAYRAFAVPMEARDRYVRAHRGHESCRTGLPIRLVDARFPARILNNREEWVGASLDQVERYYGCELVLTP